MLLLLLAVAHAETITCDAIEGPALHYEFWQKSGGNMPMENDPQMTETWTLGERVLMSAGQSYGGKSYRSGGLDWTWDPKSTVIESVRRRSSIERHIVYTARVHVVDTDGVPLGPGLGVEADAKMRCVRDPEYGIP